jgi:hypothetical protein
MYPGQRESTLRCPANCRWSLSPTSRSGFLKVTYLVTARPGVDFDAFYAYWLDVHVPEVVRTMRETGGFRYVVNHSLNPQEEPYAGMAELYFPDESAWQAFAASHPEDGIGAYIDNVELRRSCTEFIGIP